MGAKEGLSPPGPGHALARRRGLRPGPDLSPSTPTAPIIAGADVRRIPMVPGRDFLEDLEMAIAPDLAPSPSCSSSASRTNPTCQVVELDFFQRIVDFAKENNIWVIHDLATTPT